MDVVNWEQENLCGRNLYQIIETMVEIIAIMYSQNIWPLCLIKNLVWRKLNYWLLII